MWRLAGIFTISGVLHFVRPERFEAIVPHRLPARRQLVYASGAVELACAAGLAFPPTRRHAGLLSVGLLTAVYPANFQMAADALRSGSTLSKGLLIGRLPLQLPLIRTAWQSWSRVDATNNE